MMAKMKTYLSCGGGVNSVALHLMLLGRGCTFEPIYMDHGADWPETYEYMDMFSSWLEDRGQKKIKILKPEYQGYDNLYDYAFAKNMAPARWPRWCSSRFKVLPIHKYYERPCVQYLGIDSGEKHRCRVNEIKSIENRYPLVDEGIDREGCKAIIKGYGLPVPKKSGCFICPFQSRQEWIGLRREHPDLFQKAVELENNNNRYRKSIGKKYFWISKYGVPLDAIVSERQAKLFKELSYPKLPTS